MMWCNWFTQHGVLTTVSDWATLASAILGMGGTAILFSKSYTLPPFPGGYGSQSRLEEYSKAAKETRAMTFWQRVGFAILCVGFFCQLVAVLWPKR